MKNNKTWMAVEAERLCKEHPGASTLSLARRLAKEFKADLENARSAVRLVRGQTGKAHRRWMKTEKETVEMPKSIAEPWTPFQCDGKRIGIISDVHVPYHSDLALEAAIKDLKRRSIDTLLINGDFADFYQVSRWQKDPRKRRFNEERLIVVQGLQWLRQTFGTKIKILWKDGNHEERWIHFIWNRAPEVYDVPQCTMASLLEFEKVGITHISEQRPIMLGKLPVFHGHELPKGLASPVNMARGAFLRMIDTVLVGHGHRSSSHTEANWEQKEITCWSTGCLCDMSPEYARINKWNWGFAYVEVASDKSFQVQNLRVSKDGEVRAS